MSPEVAPATVVVIGAGQAGLSAAHHLQRRGFRSALEPDDDGATYVLLDSASSPGGAWQHRWESLRMATVNGIFDLPGMAIPPVDPDEPSRDAVPRYFAAYEHEHDFPILRPVRVTAVREAADGVRSGTDDSVGGVGGTGGGADGVGGAGGVGEAEGGADGVGGRDLIVETDRGTWATQWIINATGTWDNPVLPDYPGAHTFRGRQLHTRDYTSAREFAGRRVAIVGGGISAVQQLEEISRHATTFWYTRREPVFHDGPFTPETGREVIAKVTADVEEGRPTGSVVSYTGLGWTDYALAAKQRGALQRREMFTAIEPTGVREADGSFTSVDVILWATGFKGALSHLDPLGLRNQQGGLMLRGTQVADEPRVHLIGFGPSQSTVGANRAGRAAVAAIINARRDGAKQTVGAGF